MALFAAFFHQEFGKKMLLSVNGQPLVLEKHTEH